jgi:FAD binding domain-containing protein
MPVMYEKLYVGQWTQRLMLADRYRDGRVFLAGDAAHLVIPTGGLGINTGVADAVDLAWKLAGTLQGQGGPWLLESCEAERRAIGARNVSASRKAARGRRTWRAAWQPEITADSEARPGHAASRAMPPGPRGRAAGCRCYGPMTLPRARARRSAASRRPTGWNPTTRRWTRLPTGPTSRASHGGWMWTNCFPRLSAPPNACEENGGQLAEAPSGRPPGAGRPRPAVS